MVGVLVVASGGCGLSVWRLGWGPVGARGGVPLWWRVAFGGVVVWVG